jgi:hypothetical protein
LRWYWLAFPIKYRRMGCVIRLSSLRQCSSLRGWALEPKYILRLLSRLAEATLLDHAFQFCWHLFYNGFLTIRGMRLQPLGLITDPAVADGRHTRYALKIQNHLFRSLTV